ncbi:hypothetical protein BDV23DRAFT_178162 [Aspergillus alliaceus]|uniref:Uncharacterized protein n=1 Tax=Petromyces alliaceus TaxID=209559 RepID=A0A5N6G3Z2_PETAA|nr:uncharacterized protein BDW43DRAFT_318209 [Aspergillus alliaceus]KAB8235844.1 hypothetical protein BDW43DRAFT_318209 [Aspergillus alliaceus]KAE8396103.1 hypothetical protein BDV23DRAFT_178162 [Aspergillus alliaceus]
MGWNLDYSAITPGPGGTVMLGERGGAEAVVRRGQERRRRERELAVQKGKVVDETMSERTLVPESTQSQSSAGGEVNPDLTAQIKGKDDGEKSGDSDAPEVNRGKSGLRARWKEFKERNLP